MNIAVDFGGTNIKIGLVRDEEVLALSSIPSYSDQGMIARLPIVEQEIRALLRTNGYAPHDCRAIGIATPGVVDTDQQTILSINDKFSDAVGFSFRDWAGDVWSLPIAMENDARAALIGEVAYGAARGETDAVLLTFGTGIGTAAMIEGTIVRGKHYQAGIMGGHLSTDIHGNRCNCGNDGCLEAQAGHWALPDAAARHPEYRGSVLHGTAALGYRDILDAAKSGDRVGMELLDGLLHHWTAGIVNMIHAYDPEVVILSGGLMKAKEELVSALSARVGERCWTPWGQVRIVVADNPDSSVLLGLSALLRQASPFP